MYTKEQTIAMLQDAAVLIMEESSYRINWVSEEDRVVYLCDEDTDDEVALNIDELDLANPSVLLYKLTLMNP
jgi:hypothetical protein